MALSSRQENFINKSLKHPNWIRAISSKTEYEFKSVLSAIGQEGEDWFHQMAFVDIWDGLVSVADFAFPKQCLIIELDGAGHKNKEQKIIDERRDRVFFYNDYEVIRIKTPIPEEKKTYWKVFIQTTLKALEEEMEKAKEKEQNKRKRYVIYTKEEFERAFRRKLSEVSQE